MVSGWVRILYFTVAHPEEDAALGPPAEPDPNAMPTTTGVRSLLLLACSCLIAAGSVPSAAADPISDSNGNLWFNYFGDHRLDDGPWEYHLDVQARRADLGLNWQQQLVQTGFNFDLAPRVKLGGGYGWMRTHPYGDFPVLDDITEHRFYEQVVVKTPLAGLDWAHGLRFEHRLIDHLAPQSSGGFAVDERRLTHRFIYSLGVNIPLNDIYYLALSESVWVRFGSNSGASAFDQNRAYAAIGRKLNEHTKLELGFMEQTFLHGDTLVVENNHTVMVTLRSTMPFLK